MKFLTIILSSVILFYLVKPGTDAISLKSNTEQTCCGEQCSPIDENLKMPDQNKQKDDCSEKACNPFLLCCTGLLFHITEHSGYISKPEISSIQEFSYQSTFSSQYTADIWQPPKIA